MKKLNFKKVTLLFLLILCLNSLGIILLRKFYYMRIEQQFDIEISKKIEENQSFKEETLKKQDLKEQEENNLLKEFKILEDNKNSNYKYSEIGFIIIPSIDVKAPIFEGVSSDILKYGVRAF